MLMLDVDHFKDYNDTHGHPAGDKVLKIMSDIITTRLRDVDISARYGGEEFAILLPETDRSAGKMLAEEIRSQVEEYPFDNQDTQPLGTVSISIGVAEFPGDSGGASSLIQKADDALYRAKSKGRNRVVTAVEPD